MVSETSLNKIPRKGDSNQQNSDFDSDKLPTLSEKFSGSCFAMNLLQKSLPNLTAPVDPHGSFHN
jgi:hypothetical protein